MSKHLPKLLVIVGLTLLLGLALYGVNSTLTDAQAQAAATATATKPAAAATVAATKPAAAATVAATKPAVSPTPVPPTRTPGPTVVPVISQKAEWEKSGHADWKGEAFIHWNGSAEAKVEAACATCHSSTGFKSFVATGKTDAVAIGTTVTCDTCHNATAANYTSVKFPSGVVLKNLGKEALCMTCHQGRASKSTVDMAIQNAVKPTVDPKAPTAAPKPTQDPKLPTATPAPAATPIPVDEDKVIPSLGFQNIHYFAAAVTRYGSTVKGGYEYTGKTYDAYFDHVSGYQTCTDCHNSHSLEVKVAECTVCHAEGKSGKVEDLRKIRMVSSAEDYDGDGDVKEPISGEIAGLQEKLMKAIQMYAAEVAGKEITYDAATYPYFIVDANKNGKPDKGETGRYANWTPRLEKAAYNYQISIKDPGAYAHGGKYIMQLLADSIESLNTKIKTPVDMKKAQRGDAGHFDGSKEAFRHWDVEGKVPAGCVRCHTGTGMAEFLAEGANLSAKPTNGLMCETCHSDVAKGNFKALYQVKSITFPSGKAITFGEIKDASGKVTGYPAANLCLECHQGRESTTSVNTRLAGKEADTVDEKQGFINVHYFAAGATLFGTDAKGIYEYPDQKYVGQFKHDGKLVACTDCHDPHKLEVKKETCTACHKTDDPTKIRMTSMDDYDGDGKKDGGIKSEVDGRAAQLMTAIQLYAKEVSKKAIAYNPAAYPYWFEDANGNGKAEATEKAYTGWTPRLLKAAYNYQYVMKDTGAYTHNAKYVLQAMYDSMKDLSAKVKVDLKGSRP